MCGRFTRTSSREVLAEEFGVAQFVNVDLRPRYNIAPSQIVEAIIGNGAERRLGPMKWANIPFTSRSGLWGFAKVRYRGVAKNLARAQTMFALANFYSVRHQLMPAGARCAL